MLGEVHNDVIENGRWPLLNNTEPDQVTTGPTPTNPCVDSVDAASLSLHINDLTAPRCPREIISQVVRLNTKNL